MTAEELRLEASNDRTEHWKRWGPYLSERAWGTVREDYSEHGTAWEYLSARSCALESISLERRRHCGHLDRHQKICFSIALWNGRDPILKERLFGLTGNEGNHGEDVKECYFYLDTTPTHSYMKYLYKYPQAEFPYERLVEENRERGQAAARIRTARHRRVRRESLLRRLRRICEGRATTFWFGSASPIAGRRPPTLHLLPTIWFRNTWSWMPGETEAAYAALFEHALGHRVNEPTYGKRWAVFRGPPQLLFTETKLTSIDSMAFKARRNTPKTELTSTLCTDIRMLSTGRTSARKHPRNMFSM